MKSMNVVVLDVDCGAEIAKSIASIKRLGLLAVIYTTHSHAKEETIIQQTSFLSWCARTGHPPEPTDQSVSAFLSDIRSYTPTITASCRYKSTQHEAEGVQIVVAHDPMPKYRIVLFPKDPFIFAERKGGQQVGMREWARCLKEVAARLHLQIDEACLDPARAFYFPRHAIDAPFEVHVVVGTEVNLDEVGQGNDNVSDQWMAAGIAMAGPGSGPVRTASNFDVTAWYRDHGESFQLSDFLRDRCPDMILEDHGSKLSIICPYDGEHSNPGDHDDRGTFAANGEDNPTGTRIVIHCRHNACIGRTTPNFICKAIEDECFKAEDLKDPVYDLEIDEEELPEPTPLGDGLKVPDGYFVRDGWLAYREGKTDSVQICSLFKVLGKTHDDASRGWSWLVEITDPLGLKHSVALPWALIATNRNAMSELLAEVGLRVHVADFAKQLLAQFFNRLEGGGPS